MGLLLGWSQIRARFAERPSGLLGMFCLVNSRNLVFSPLAMAKQVSTPRSQVFLCLRLVEQVSQLLFRPARSEMRQTRLSHLESRLEQRHASQLFPVFLLRSQCPRLIRSRMRTNTHGSSGELHGTITATHTAQRMSSALPVPFVPSGVELVSRATYINRKKRNRETCWRQSKALKRVLREAKRKLVAQPEISHEAAEAILKSQAARTDEKFPGIIHVSHRLALLHGHENVFFCTQCGAVNAGGSLRLLKSLCDGSGESRQKARRKLERGLMPNEHVVADAKRAF